MRTTSERGRNFIKDFESLSLTPYQDEAGVWTIGWGHTGPAARTGTAISITQADLYFESDIRPAEKEVNRHVKRALTQSQFDALVSFEFNTGGLMLGGGKPSKVLQLVNALRDDEVDDAMREWVWVTNPKTKQKRKSRGLVRRRNAEGALWLSGCADTTFVEQSQLTKATPEPDKVVPKSVAKDAGVQVATVAVAGTAITAAVDTLQPMAESSDLIRGVVVVLVLLSVGFALYRAARA